jgi:glycosyltransferase involved in cell wall biosynthesis
MSPQQSMAATAPIGRAGSVERVDTLGVDFLGQFDLVTGLGESSRGFARALRDAGVPAHLLSVGDMYPGVARTDAALYSDPRRFPVSIEHVNADTTARFLRRFGRELSGLSARIAVWYWELAAFRPDWLVSIEPYDEIWVASSFGRRAVSAVTNTPVVVLPPPVTLVHDAAPAQRAAFGIPDAAFVFLYVFDYSSYVDRKNPFCLTDAFVTEFGDDPRTVLVLKVSHGDTTADGFRRLEDLAREHANVTLIGDILDGPSLAGLFEASDCYVSPHRSEGFGLTVAEAMLRGLPVIATDYGSTTDFLSKATGYPLRFELSEIEADQGPYSKGYVWADASREHLRELMRHVFDHPEDARAKGAAGRAFVREAYSVEAVGTRMRQRLGNLHAGACA